jgi:hypothetical protein
MVFRDGGCTHMTCRKPGGCGHEFCYICLADIRGHADYYSCARRPIDEAFATKQEQAKAQVAVETFYANGISAQRAQAKQAIKSLPAVRELGALLCASISGHLLPADGMTFLEEAVRTVAAGRKTLYHALIHGRLIPSGAAYLPLFQDQQSQFESQIGRLSSLVSEAGVKLILEGGGGAAKLIANVVAANTPEALAAAREAAAETDFERFSAWRKNVVFFVAAAKKFRVGFLDSVRYRDFGA